MIRNAAPGLLASRDGGRERAERRLEIGRQAAWIGLRPAEAGVAAGADGLYFGLAGRGSGVAPAVAELGQRGGRVGFGEGAPRVGESLEAVVWLTVGGDSPFPAVFKA